MSAVPEEPVRIEILARTDCPSRGMAIAVVEKVVADTGVPAEIEVVDMASELEAQLRCFLGSPTVRVEGRDVDQNVNGHKPKEFTLDDRVYRTDRGLAGWPDERWVREAVLLAVGRFSSNGTHESSSKSSATSP